MMKAWIMSSSAVSLLQFTGRHFPPAMSTDVTFTPAGPRLDYADWHERAGEVEIADGLTVRVASLDDVISSKRAAGRDKDLHALPYLESLRDELKGREDLA